MFMVYLLALHWKHARQYTGGFFLLAGSYHWTPAFPAFYVALAVPVGAWITAGQSELEPRLRWILPVSVAIALLVLGWCNLHSYFHHYYADPESLKSKAYRSAQRNYEVQTAQSRYSASLGPDYKVFTIGQSSWPYDPATTGYLVREQKWTLLTNPATERASINRDNKGVAFLFFPGNEQYQQTTRELFPGGKNGEVTTRRGKHLFDTYVLTPPLHK